MNWLKDILEWILALLGRVNVKQNETNQKLNKILMTLDDLQAKVDAETTVNQSAITLLNGLHDLLIQAGQDPVKLKALADQLQANTDDLSAAITANTPAAP